MPAKRQGAESPLASDHIPVEECRKVLLSLQLEEGYWSFELEADCSIPAEYILMQQTRWRTP